MNWIINLIDNYPPDYEAIGMSDPIRSEEQLYNIIKEAYNKGIQDASESVDANLELISGKANAAWESRSLIKGEDYEIGINRDSILKLKL